MIQMVSDRDGTAIYNKYPEMRAWIGQHMPQLSVYIQEYRGGDRAIAS